MDDEVKEVIPVVIHKDDTSDYCVSVPGLTGCFSSGRTLKEACDNIKEAIDVHIDAMLERVNGDVDLVGIDISPERALLAAEGGIVVLIEHVIKHDINFDV